MQNLTPEYIVGLVDGEGSFTVYVQDPKSSHHARRVLVEPRFYIKLIERDKEILDKLQQYFGCGKVYFQKDTRKNHQNCYRYEVFNRNELSSVIVPFFKKYQLQFPSKRNDFEIFCEMLQLIEQKVHLTVNGLESLFQLKQRMH
jgi:hypothetical protein